MIVLQVSDKLSVTLYESADEMPMDLYFMRNQYGVLDYEAGSSLEDVNKRFERLDMFMVNNQREEMLQERSNMHQTFFNIITKIHFPSLQFGCHIKAVNGEPLQDYSPKTLIATMDRMGKEGFTYKSLTETLEGLKKKLNMELALMFPDKYQDTARLNYLSQIKAKALAELNYVLTGEERYLHEIKGVVGYFQSLLAPKNISWTNSKNIIIEAKRSYEKVCSLLMQSGIPNPGQLSIIKFHVAVDTYDTKRRTKS